MSISKSEVKNQKLKTLPLTGWRFAFLLKSFFLFYILTAFFVLSSCHYKEPAPPPPGLIDETEMSKLICDMTLVESALNNEPLAAFNDTLKKVNVLKEHNATSQQFLLSMKYYSENPQKLKSIYTQAQEILNERVGIRKDTMEKK